ncbi:hypothetical protein [Streptomyces sp. NPDC057253]|uniref:hypothetical protein n=1 Tax=Streptomyces sp. NPDC057253 TaxID=3346069 RepID=UPI003645DB33
MALISVPEGGCFTGKVRVTRASVQSVASSCSTTGGLYCGSRSERPVRWKLPVPTRSLGAHDVEGLIHELGDDGWPAGQTWS